MGEVREEVRRGGRVSSVGGRGKRVREEEGVGVVGDCRSIGCVETVLARF